MVPIAPKATATSRFLQRMKDLIGSNKVLELGPGFTTASQQFLKAPSTSLSDIHLLSAAHVRLQGLGAPIRHLIRLHGGH